MMRFKLTARCCTCLMAWCCVVLGLAARAASDDVLLEKKGEPVRVRFKGTGEAGYDVEFECRAGKGWKTGAAFVPGQVWNIYSDWRDSWYADGHAAKVQNVQKLPGDRLRASATLDVAGQPWWVADVYSLEHGMVRIDRSFAHPGQGTQTNITLETRVRMPLGSEQRMLMPGVLYNNNPGSTLIGTKISTAPGGLGLYEEHRLPIPMVTVESSVEGGRLYSSLVAKPSKILQGHKGSDHWWSLGLEYGEGYVDLLSVSGPLATNGKKSQIYGHRHGFDPYDDAYLDVQGPVVVEKTLYLDLGKGVKTGYAFRETLWKAFEVFQPTATSHVSFPEAMALVTDVARKMWRREQMPFWKSGHAAAVVRFGKVQIVEGDALVIIRPDGKKDIYKFYDTGKKNPYPPGDGEGNKIIGIEIAERDAYFTKTADRVVAAINANPDSPVVVQIPKFLAMGWESWGVRLAAKKAGEVGCKIGLAEQGGKIEFNSNLAGPWGRMGSEPRTKTLVLGPILMPEEERPIGYSFMYGWVGGGLGIPYGVLSYADRTGDAEARQQAIAAVQYFVKHSPAEAEGLFYGDYNVGLGEWVHGGFEAAAPGISSRQYGENLESLASLVELGLRMKLPEAQQWLATLKKAGDFLIRSPRYKGLYPRAWTPKGEAVGWPADGDPQPGVISAAGAQCAGALGRLASLTGDAKYRAAAVEAMEAYWREFGQTLATAPWGATLDAGAEDKEACWGMMRAALQVYVGTQEPRFLQMAKDAADLALTWMYFHDIGFKPESDLLLRDYLHTVGWTFISTQNQEIDVWGYFMAPDFYRLGQVSGDVRYRQIGRVLFEACTQTLSRPGAMFLARSGTQCEHYNHSNCTYHPGQPGNWRGTQQSPGMHWTTSGAMYGGMRLADFASEEFFLGPKYQENP